MENASLAVGKLFGGSAPAEEKEGGEKGKAVGSKKEQKAGSADGEIPMDSKVDDEKTPSRKGVATDVSSSGIGEGEATVDTEVAPAVEHTHVNKTHETREQTHIQREIHQDHYHTTIQPLTEAVVAPEKQDYVLQKEEKAVGEDDGRAAKKAKLDLDAAVGDGPRLDVEEGKEKVVGDGVVVREVVHHHLHQTILPVIEKGWQSYSDLA